MSQENFGYFKEQQRNFEGPKTKIEQNFKDYQEFLKESLSLIEENSSKLIKICESFKELILRQEETKEEEIKIEEIDNLSFQEIKKLYEETKDQKENDEKLINLKIKNFLANLKNLEKIEPLDEFINQIFFLRSNFQEIISDLMNFRILESKVKKLGVGVGDFKLREKGFDSYESLLESLNTLYKEYQRLEDEQNKLESSFKTPLIGKILSYLLNKEKLNTLAEQKDDISRKIKDLDQFKDEVADFYFQQSSSLYFEFENLKKEILSLLFKKTQENFKKNFENFSEEIKNFEQFFENKIKSSSSEFQETFSTFRQELEFCSNSFKFLVFSRLSENYLPLFDVFKNIYQTAYFYDQFYGSFFDEKLNEVYKELNKISIIFSNFDFQRWQSFKNSEKIKENFKSILNLTENAFVDFFILSLINQILNNKNRLMISNLLFNFKTPKAIFFNALNSFSEPGESGDYPFIFHKENCELIKYLKSLDEEQIESFEKFYEQFEELKSFSDFIKKLKTKKENQIEDYYDLIERVFVISFELLKQDRENFKYLIFRAFRVLFNQHPSILENVRLELTFDRILTLFRFLVQEPHFIFNKEFYVGSRIFFKKVFKEIFKNLHDLNKEDLSFLRNYGVVVAGLFFEDKNLNFILEKLAEISKPDNLSVEDLKKGAEAISYLIQNNYSFRYDSSKIKDLAIFFSNDSSFDFISKLINEFKYYFDMKDLSVLNSLIKEKDEFIKKCREIKSFYPKFSYFIKTVDLQLEEESCYREILQDPYQALAYQIEDFDEFLRYLYSLKNSLDDINSYRKILKNLIWSLKLRFSIFELEEESNFQKIIQSLDFLIEKITDKNNPIHSYLQNLNSYNRSLIIENLIRIILKYSRINSKILEELLNQEFLSLIQPGGPLYLNKEFVFKEIFLSPNPLFRINHLKRSFLKRMPYWKILFLYTRLRLANQLESYSYDYPITKISSVPLKEINPNRLETILTDDTPKDLKEKLKKGEIKSLLFKYLKPEFKKVVFRSFLRDTIRFSRSEKFKKAADQRNREFVLNNIKNNKGKLSLKSGMYFHGSAIDFLDSVLLNGNLPREALGELASTDAIPFHVDFTKLNKKFIENYNENIREIISNSLSFAFGIHGKFGRNGQIFYLYPPSSERKWEKDIDYVISSDISQGDHALILGGMPATEILTIILIENFKTTLEMAKRRIVDNGFYIPLYDIDGNLIFSSEEYDKLYEDLNMSVKVEVWDYSFKTGGQKGGNPGAEYTLPAKTKTAKPEKYYVKFASLDEEERLNQLWCEVLSDRIYQLFSIPVPETKMVKVEGVYGRASRLIETSDIQDESFILSSQDLLEGFLIDVLLANWDVLYTTTQNVVLGKDERVYRIDNGGTLIFRALGKRKEIEDLLDEEKFKKELDALLKQEKYQSLTKDNLKQKALEIKSLLDDDKIEELVNNVRLSYEDRRLIFNILTTRRNFILKYFLQEN